MDYHCTIEQKPTYLHLIGSGAHTESNARRFLVDAYTAALERKCGSLLLEMRFSGPSLSLGKIYSVISQGSPDGSALERIAYVDANAEHVPDMAKFAELVARNRGVNVRLFRDVPDAERWLSEATGEFDQR
jgi:hypothetical protein